MSSLAITSYNAPKLRQYELLPALAVFVFRNRRATAVKILVYDGQGFWLCYERLSSGRFRWWPTTRTKAATTLAAHQLQVLLSAGNPEAARAALPWRPVGPKD